LQLQNPSNYALYCKEKANRECYETDHGFVTYSHISDYAIYIHDIFILKEFRQSRHGTKMVDDIVQLTRCKEIQSQVIIDSNGVEEAIKAHLGYGFKVSNAHNGKIYFIKEV